MSSWVEEEERQAYEEFMQMQRHRQEELFKKHVVEHMLKLEIKELIGFIGSIIYKLMSYKESFDPWIKEQPKNIQKLATKYPPGTYTIKSGDLVEMIKPGGTVLLMSWLENGTVGITISAKNKSEKALENETKLCKHYKKTESETKEILNADVSLHINPNDLVLVKSEI